MNGVTYATGAIANQINPYWAMEEVNRARIRYQTEEDRVQRERVRIQAEIQSRMRQYEETLTGVEMQITYEAELRRQLIENRIDHIYTQLHETRWTRLKNKINEVDRVKQGAFFAVKNGRLQVFNLGQMRNSFVG